MLIIQMQGLCRRTGTTTVSVALSYSLSRNGKKILLINASPTPSNADIFCTVDEVVFGWLNVNDNILKNAFSCDENLWYIPTGKVNYENNILKSIDSKSIAKSPKLLQDRVSHLFESIQELGFDYVIVDAGLRKNNIAKNFEEYSSVTISVMEPEPNCIAHLNEAEIADNEYVLLSKCDYRNSILGNLDLYIRNSSLSEKILTPKIPLDEFVTSAYLNRKPVTKMVPFAASSVEIEKLIADLLHISGKSK